VVSTTRIAPPLSVVCDRWSTSEAKMSTTNSARTGGDLLVARLRDFGVRRVFGYPGGPLTPLYDALYREPAVRHILSRHEQGAAFMADGAARATGQPSVCITVCGPGAFNASTPIAGAFSDSVPVLLINGQVPSREPRSGYYHENDQLRAFAPFTKAQIRVERVADLIPELDWAWITLTENRPGPVLFEVTGDVLRAEAPCGVMPPMPSTLSRLAPTTEDVQRLARLIGNWRRPLLIAGGGVISSDACPELLRVAERLGAPVFHTLMGKTALRSDHPLAAGLPWKQATSDASNMAEFMSPLFAQADGMLAIGCRFTQVATGTWALRPPQALAQIDVDRTELGRHYPVVLGVQADAREALRALLALLPDAPRATWADANAPREPGRMGGMDLCSTLRRALPRDTIVVADVTQLAYRMLVDFPVYQPRTFLHPAGGVAMGYGLPAALGAKAMLPERPVVAVVGDGCFQMTGMELGTAMQEQLPVVIVLIHDGSLTLIKMIQHRRYQDRFLGVDLRNPDFGMLARAFGVRAWRVDTEPTLEEALREALACGQPGLVEVVLRAR
jgi:acetolactate synthase-1/2/3 large subunit